MMDTPAGMIDIKADAHTLERLLEEMEFEYDADYTALYGTQWQFVGIRIMRRHADVFAAIAQALER